MVPKASIHLGGYSSGGTFTHYAAAQLNDILASISPGLQFNRHFKNGLTPRLNHLPHPARS